MLWLGLMFSNVGRASLSNLIEGAWLMIASVVLAYVQVFFIDRFVKRPTRTTRAIAVILCVAAVILRVVMPAFPE
jgi:hypothetical protein